MTTKEQIQDVIQTLNRYRYRTISLDELLEIPHYDRMRAVDRAIVTVEFNEEQPTRYRNPDNPAILDALNELRNLLSYQNFDEQAAENAERSSPRQRNNFHFFSIPKCQPKSVFVRRWVEGTEPIP